MTFTRETLIFVYFSGEILVISVLPSFRPQVQYSCISQDDPLGINSVILTTSGQGFYLLSSSEYGRFSLSTSSVTENHCRVNLDPSTPIVPIPLSRFTTAQMVNTDGNHADKPKVWNIFPEFSLDKLGIIREIGYEECKLYLQINRPMNRKCEQLYLFVENYTKHKYPQFYFRNFTVKLV